MRPVETGRVGYGLSPFVARAHYDAYVRPVPANAATVFIHLLTGLFLSAAYLLDRAVRPFM
jgi:hypothetical protein